jgi:hypothetical protein
MMVEKTGWWRRKSLAARPERPEPDVALIAKSDARARSADGRQPRASCSKVVSQLEF